MKPSNPSKFIGKKATPCRKCNSPMHYVNPMGGISCFSCYPPKRPEHVTLRLICEGGVWTTEDQAFFVPDSNAADGSSNRSADGVTSPPTPTGPPAAADQHQSSRQVVRRKSSDDYTDLEINSFFCPGGMLDQMDESAGRRPYRIPVCRAGETITERDDRLQRFRLGHRGFEASRKFRSNLGAVPAELVELLRFVERSFEDDHGRVRHDTKDFPLGEKCLLFPGRKPPRQDPQASSIEEALRAKGDEANRFAVIRLDELLRVVPEKTVRICS